MKILAVTGITGHSGRFFLQELNRHSFEGTVKCLVRKTSNTTELDRSCLKIEKILGDITCEESLQELFRGADTVLHISGIRYSPAVIQTAIHEKVKRVVLVHTTGIYSKHKMAAQEYKDIEEKLTELLKAASLDVTVLRPTMIFGDLCDHNIHKFIRMVDKLLLMPEIEHGSGMLQPVNARDLAKAYYLAVTRTHLPKYDYVISGERAISMHELFVQIGEYLGKKVRFISCPMWLGVFLARCLKVVTAGRRDFVERVLRMGENRAFSHEAASRDLGYCASSFQNDLKREVEEYRAVYGREKS